VPRAEKFACLGNNIEFNIALNESVSTALGKRVDAFRTCVVIINGIRSAQWKFFSRSLARLIQSQMSESFVEMLVVHGMSIMGRKYWVRLVGKGINNLRQ
jgi:hypothetical protein